jgi:hypothetical protein
MSKKSFRAKGARFRLKGEGSSEPCGDPETTEVGKAAKLL